jgi:hypothetical protein
MHLDSRYKCIRPCVNRVAIVCRQQFVDNTGVLGWKTSEAERYKDCEETPYPIPERAPGH